MPARFTHIWYWFVKGRCSEYLEYQKLSTCLEGKHVTIRFAFNSCGPPTASTRHAHYGSDNFVRVFQTVSYSCGQASSDESLIFSKIYISFLSFLTELRNMTRFTRSRRKKTLKAVATSLCKRFAINIYRMYIEINFNRNVTRNYV